MVALVCTQLAAALHYLPISPISFGLALIAPAYAITSLTARLAEGETVKKAFREPALFWWYYWQRLMATLNSFHTLFCIPVSLWEQMRADVLAHLPEEACGLLVGLGERARVVMPITNTLHSPVRFRLDARQQLDAFVWMENQALELVGIYHSHPAARMRLRSQILRSAITRKPSI